MAVAGEIVINVLAKTSGYTKGLADARSQTVGFSNSITQSMAGLKSWGVGMLGAAAILATLRKGLQEVVESFQRMDKIGALSSRTGMATHAIMGLGAAAQESGSSVEELQSGLQQMVRRISEAATGTGAAAKALQELRLSASSLNKSGPYASLLSIAEAMKHVQNQSDQLRLTYELFGRSGVGLTTMLSLSARELHAFTTEALRSGPLERQIRNVERANDAWDRFKNTMTNLKDRALAGFSPILEGISDALEGLTEGMKRNVQGELFGLLQTGPLTTEAIRQLQARRAERDSRLDMRAEIYDSMAVRRKAEMAAIEQEARAREEALRKAEESVRAPQFAGAVVRGTTEAFNAVIEARAEQQRMIDLEQAQLGEQQKMVNQLEGIRVILMDPNRRDPETPVATVIPARR